MKENDIGNDTKMQLNILINNLQSRAFSNSNNSYNDEFINSKVKNLDINVFKSFGINDNNNVEKENKEINDIKLTQNSNDKKDTNKIQYNLYQKYPSSEINNNNIYNNNNINLNNNSNISYFYQNPNNFNSFKNYNINSYNNESFTYSDIKYIIRNEFIELMVPYQKQVNTINN